METNREDDNGYRDTGNPGIFHRHDYQDTKESMDLSGLHSAGPTSAYHKHSGMVC